MGEDKASDKFQAGLKKRGSRFKQHVSKAAKVHARERERRATGQKVKLPTKRKRSKGTKRKAGIRQKYQDKKLDTSEDPVTIRQKRAARKLERSKKRADPKARKAQKEVWKRQRKAMATQGKPQEKRGTTKTAVEQVKKAMSTSKKVGIGLGATAGLAATGYGIYRIAKAAKHRRALVKAKSALGEGTFKRAVKTAAFGSSAGEAPGFFGGLGHATGATLGAAAITGGIHKAKKWASARRKRRKKERETIARAKAKVAK